MNHQIHHPHLAILGCYPPPYGGVAVHIKRLMPLLEERKISYRVYNAVSNIEINNKIISVSRFRRRWMLSYLFTAKENTIYITSDRLPAWIIGALLSHLRKKRVLIRLRNAAFINWVNKKGLRRFLCKQIFKNIDSVICVNQALEHSVKKLGIPPERIRYSPGFLPPTSDEYNLDAFPLKLYNFISSHKPILSTNGKIAWHNECDLYGFDHILELSKRLVPIFPKLGVIIHIIKTNTKEDSRINELKAIANNFNIGSHIYFHAEPGPFVPFLTSSDIFLRPTNTDGDSNSIRESLYLGVPVIASDCVARPNNINLFKCRDIDDFERVTKEVLSRIDKIQSKTTHLLPLEDRNRIQKYLELLAT